MSHVLFPNLGIAVPRDQLGVIQAQFDVFKDLEFIEPQVSNGNAFIASRNRVKVTFVANLTAPVSVSQYNEKKSSWDVVKTSRLEIGSAEVVEAESTETPFFESEFYSSLEEADQEKVETSIRRMKTHLKLEEQVRAAETPAAETPSDDFVKPGKDAPKLTQEAIDDQAKRLRIVKKKVAGTELSTRVSSLEQLPESLAEQVRENLSLGIARFAEDVQFGPFQNMGDLSAMFGGAGGAEEESAQEDKAA